MSTSLNDSLLEALLDSWDRNNRILVNLLGVVPEGGLAVRAMDGGQTVAQLFTHVHSVRLVFVAENAPEFAMTVPEHEWADERDPARIGRMLEESARVVREAVRGRLAAGKAMDRLYDHPILFLQHMIWHDAYHHGQIKLALKLAGQAIPDKEAGPGTWGVWMRKTPGAAPAAAG